MAYKRLMFVTVKKVLSLCDSLSAIDDIRNGVLCLLVDDFMSMLKVIAGPFAQRDSTTHVVVCLRLSYDSEEVTKSDNL